MSPSLGIKADSSRIATKETCIWFNSLMGKFIFEPLRTQLSRTETKLLLSEILNDQVKEISFIVFIPFPPCSHTQHAVFILFL